MRLGKSYRDEAALAPPARFDSLVDPFVASATEVYSSDLALFLAELGCSLGIGEGMLV